MKLVPFTAHVRIIANKLSKKFENIRNLQKVSEAVYDAFVGIASVNIATPGGGQQRSFGGSDFGSNSGLAYGCTYKPRFGNIPPQLMITGFYDPTALNLQPHVDRQLIHANEFVSGPGGHSWESNPTSTINIEVIALKTAMDAALVAADLPVNVVVSVFRLDYSGITYGNRGYHFPQ